MKTPTHYLLFALLSTLPLAAQDEKPFEAIPLYKAPDDSKEEEVADRKLVQMEKAEVDGISRFVQDFYKKYNKVPLADVLTDKDIGNFLTEDYVARLKRAQRAAKISGAAIYMAGHASTSDLYKFTAAFSTAEKDVFITDFAVGESTSDEMIYMSHIWVVLKKQGDSWRVSDLRDMGNG